MSSIKNMISDRVNQRRYLRFLVRLTAKSQKNLLAMLGLNTFAAVASITLTLVNKAIVDTAQNRIAVRWLVVLMIGLQLASFLAGIIENIFGTIATERYAQSVRRILFGQLMSIPWLKRTSYHSEDLLSRIVGDVGQITGGVSMLVVTGGALLIRLVLAFLLLWRYSPLLSIIVVVMAPLGAVGSMFVMRYIRDLQEQSRKLDAEYHIFLQERISKLELVQIFGHEQYTLADLDEVQARRLQMIRKRNLFSVTASSILGLTFMISSMTAFVMGALMVSDGKITFGMMTAFLSLVSQIQSPIVSLAGYVPSIAGILASAGRIMEVVELEAEIPLEAPRPENPQPMGLRAEHLGVGYRKGPVVKDVSFDIAPGKMVMLAGRSGIGKTTLLRCIMGFLPPMEGKLEFYNADTTIPCSPESRFAISYVPQGNTLFLGTIADNLRMADENATAEQMRKALEIADALEFVDRLPHGLDTHIGERAAGISEGQAQRISIARALLKPASLLILDEATSALDEATEAKILEGIFASHNATCLFVSHRSYLQKYADEVIRL